MPRWTQNDIARLKQRNPNLVPSGQVPDAKPQRNKTISHVGSGGREEQGVRCPIVRFTLRRVHLLDVDAKWGSVKDLLDGCWRSGLIPGDKEGEITLEVRQERVPHYKEEETLIYITWPKEHQSND